MCQGLLVYTACCLRVLWLPQAKRVQELVVAIIRAFTEAYGPLILVLGERAKRAKQPATLLAAADDRLPLPRICAESAAPLLPLLPPPRPQRTCTTLTPPAGAC